MCVLYKRVLNIFFVHLLCSRFTVFVHLLTFEDWKIKIIGEVKVEL